MRSEGRAVAADPFVRLLPAVVAVAVVLRLASALYQGNTVVDLPGIFDQISYHALSQRVVEGHGFSFADGHWPVTEPGAPTAHWSFLYTLYLAAIYAIVGDQPVVARIIQALLVGVAHPWLVYRIGRRVFDPVTALIAAALSGIYVYFVYYAGGLLTEAFYIVGILWTIDVALRLREHPASFRPVRPWLEFGLAIGVTGLLRQVFLLFVPVLFAWLLWTARRTALRGLIATATVVVLLVAPWTIRNYRAFGTVVLLNTNAGFALYWGNHPIHGTRFMPLLPGGGPSYAELIPRRLLSLNEGMLDRALAREALRFVGDDPVRFVRLSLSRAVEYFKFWPSAQSGIFSNIARMTSFGLVLPLALAGIVLAVHPRASKRERIHASGVFLLLAFAGTYSLVHLLSWTLIRYRLPVDSVLVLFAAFAIGSAAHSLEWTPHREPAVNSQ